MSGIMYAEKHFNWKGGRHVGTNGYIWRYARGHPRACTDGHYVYEHILIMEKHLGRYLEPNEEIHHINGIKTDNRLENLELHDSHKEHMQRHIIDKSNWICILCNRQNQKWWYYLNRDRTKPICAPCRVKRSRRNNLERQRKYDREYSRMRRALGLKK